MTAPLGREATLPGVKVAVKREQSTDRLREVSQGIDPDVLQRMMPVGGVITAMFAGVGKMGKIAFAERPA